MFVCMWFLHPRNHGIRTNFSQWQLLQIPCAVCMHRWHMRFRDQTAICDWTRKKRKPKFKPRPHCLGNKCNSKLSLTLFSPHPAHLTWFGPTLSCFVLLCSALDTIHSCISLSVLYLSQQYSFCTDYAGTMYMKTIRKFKKKVTTEQ